MKRLLIVVALALSCASPSFAQQKNMEFVAGTKIEEDLKALAACVGLTGVIFDRGANLPGLQLMTSVNTPDCTNLALTLPTAQTILPPIYTAYLEDNTLHVKLRATFDNPQPALAVSAGRPEPRAVSGPIVPADDYAAISEHVHRAMLGDAAYERAVADNLHTPSLFSGPYRTGGLVIPYPGGGLAVPQPGYDNYSGYSGYGDHAYVQQQIDRDTWGGLRFKKGDEEDVMENVEIWGCGQRIIQADEGNNFFDHIVLVPIGCRPLTFRYTDGEKKDWEVQIDELIVPLRLQKSKNITLDQKFFDRARDRTERLRYSMVEQPDGSLKRVIRTPSN